MVKRTDMSMPRASLRPGEDATAKLNWIYDNPKLGDRRGKSAPVKNWAPDQHQNQFPENKHGPGYCPDVPSDWRRGMGAKRAEGRPTYDHHGSQRSPAKSLGGGKTNWKSPFSKAHKTYDGD